MKLIMISLLLLAVSVGMMVTGNRLIQTSCGDGIFPKADKKKRWKLGHFLIWFGIALFFGTVCLWTGYARSKIS